jgi:hypothetical protein
MGKKYKSKSVDVIAYLSIALLVVMLARNLWGSPRGELIHFIWFAALFTISQIAYALIVTSLTKRGVWITIIICWVVTMFIGAL